MPFHHTKKKLYHKNVFVFQTCWLPWRTFKPWSDIFILYFKNKYSSFFFVVWLPAFVTDLFCVLRAVPSFPMVIYHVHGVDGGVVTGCGEASIVGGPSVTHADKGGHWTGSLYVDDQIAIAHTRSVGRRHPARLLPIFTFFWTFVQPQLGSQFR